MQAAGGDDVELQLPGQLQGSDVSCEGSVRIPIDSAMEREFGAPGSHAGMLPGQLHVPGVSCELPERFPSDSAMETGSFHHANPVQRD